MTMRQLPWPKKENVAQDYVVPETLYLTDISNKYASCTVPVGTKIRIQTCRNYGLVVVPEELNANKRIWRR